MKLAIFDIDGTLTDTNSVDSDCFVRALSEVLAMTEIDTDWAAYPHTTDSGIIMHLFQEKFGRHPEENELRDLKSCFVRMLSVQSQSSLASFAEIRGASIALHRLKQESAWAVAIATGSWRESALLKLRAAKIDVDGIPAAYAEDGLSREEILQSAVSRSMEDYCVSSFGKIVSIGDGVWDVRAARYLGFAFLGIGCGQSASILSEVGARDVIEDFADYSQLVRSLNNADVPTLGTAK